MKKADLKTSDAVIDEMKRRIARTGLSLKDVASEVGVGVGSLERHLSGAYVRSDSLAKYRGWLLGAKAGGAQLSLPAFANAPRRQEQRFLNLVDALVPPGRPAKVVDLFSGCGGMSLGFDLHAQGRAFKTVLALDIDDAMVRVFNDNHPSVAPICRQVDLSEFESEAEVVAFYLEHLAALGDHDVAAALRGLPGGGLDRFLESINAIDSSFLEELTARRESDDHRSAVKAVSEVLGQTSVIGFHSALRLPMPGRKTESMAPLPWASAVIGGSRKSLAPSRATRDRHDRRLSARWTAEVDALRRRATATGRGQLSSSAGKIGRFIQFLDTKLADDVRQIWLRWRSERDALCEEYFSDVERRAAVAALYQGERRVDVLLGGPPCQGFSRIGRGKLRSLRESGVQVHEDAEAGDERNRLLFKYVLFLAALAPDVFLFENVRHFEAEVKTPDGTYLATDVLAQAIRDVSGSGLTYHVASSVIDASRHLVPQTRERFFMSGVRDELASAKPVDLPRWLLTLEERPDIDLAAALRGLPAPFVVGEAGEKGISKEVVVSDLGDGDSVENLFLRWVGSRPAQGHATHVTDAHYARPTRADDAAAFEMFGPGKRWMDYRCDESETLRELREGLRAARELLSTGNATSRDAAARLAALEERVDGSLSLRLLLESIEPLPGELGHHLLTDAYLGKREGMHGDWMARLHPARPGKTIVSHMAKDTYAYVHPWHARTLTVREAARVQSFPDWFRFGSVGLVDAFRIVGNAVPPLLSAQLAERVAQLLSLRALESIRSPFRRAEPPQTGAIAE